MGNASKVQWAPGGWKPVLCLFLIAPMAGELITSSAPPFIFFIPWVFILFALLYGCGAILIREMAMRWQTGWTGILLMGAAYGILEEGLGAKSFFDPNWRALGPLGSHGRWLGVNWVWTIGLTLFHSGFCVAISILAASLPFPQLRHTRWLGGKSLTAVAIAYFFVLLLFFQKGNENRYQAPASYYMLSIAAAVALVMAAWRGPRRVTQLPLASDVPAARLGWLGFLAIIAFVLILYALPATGVSAWVTAGMHNTANDPRVAAYSQPLRAHGLSLDDADDEAQGAIGEGAFLVMVPWIGRNSKPARVNISLDQSMLDAIDAAASLRRLTRSAFLAAAYGSPGW